MSKEKSLLQRFNDGEELTIDEHAQLQKHLAELKSSPVLPMPDNSRPSVEDTRFSPVVAKQDNEGHWYVIPAEMGDEFDNMLEVAPADYHEAFIEKFSDYRTGGELNLTQLYIKAETLERDLNDDSTEGGPIGPEVPGHSIDTPTRSGPDIDVHGIAGPSANPASGPMFPRFLNHADYSRIFTEGINKMADTTLPIPEKYKLSSLEMVEAFHKAFNCPVYETPVIPDVPYGYALVMDHIEKIKHYFGESKDKSRAFLRIKLIFEEFTEVVEAISTHDMVKILDGLCDLLYVVYGTAHEFGLGPVLKEAFAEVHRSNMSKLGTDGKPVMREDGKVLKGPYFTPPDLAGILLKHGAYTKDTYPEWDKETWREAVNKAIKEGPKKAHEAYDNLGISASLGANMPEIPGMPEPTSGGVIYSDLKVGEVTQSEDESINVEITGIKHTPAESIKATIEFKQTIGNEISIDDIELIQTCIACPEQYDAFYQGKQVGYLRLRHGYFRVDWGECGGETIFEGNPDGDGEFTSVERQYFLDAAKRAIIERILKEPTLGELAG